MAEIMELTNKINKEELKRAVFGIKHGKIVIYPTDTLYGIGGNALDKKVFERVHEIKGSPKDKPVSVIMADIEMIKEYCELNKEQEKIIKKYLPGPYTFLLRMKKEMPCGKDGKIGVRIPKSKEILLICKHAKIPIITTSANIHGSKPAAKLEEIPKEILNSADIIIKGETPGEPSTIVDLIERKIIRKGIGEFSF